jgi:hypothetical protein
MNYFPNRDDAYRMMPGPAGQPALRGMAPDLSDIGGREPPSAAIFGAISWFMRRQPSARARHTRARRRSPRLSWRGRSGRQLARSPIAPAGCTLLDRMRRALYERTAQRCRGASAASRRISRDKWGEDLRGRKRNSTSSLRVNERQAAFTS